MAEPLRVRFGDYELDEALVSFGPANISAAAFWHGKGFRPVYYGLLRHIDERIALPEDRRP